MRRMGIMRKRYKVIIQRSDGGTTEVVTEAINKEEAKKNAVKNEAMLYGKCKVLAVKEL